jgi:hypothetical protein
MAGYTDGDAKWFFDPIKTLTPGQQYRFSVNYKGSVIGHPVAMFLKADGTEQYFGMPVPLSTSTTAWQSYSDTFSVPTDAAPVSARPVKVLEVHDGDSLKGEIDLGYGFRFTPAGGIRAFGYDCWEVTKTRQTVGEISDVEVLKGKLARDEFADLCKAGQLYAEDSGEHDPYGRASAILWVKAANGEWIYVARWMDHRGHLRVPLNGQR